MLMRGEANSKPENSPLGGKFTPLITSQNSKTEVLFGNFFMLDFIFLQKCLLRYHIIRYITLCLLHLLCYTLLKTRLTAAMSEHNQ